MNNYQAYGLCFESEIVIPEFLPAGDEKPDVRIRFSSIDLSCLDGANPDVFYALTPAGIFLYWKKVGAFLVRNGEEILIDPIPGVEERTVRLGLLGMVLGMLLYQRGHLVLHASAVEIGRSAAIFLGDKGQGKSTMAASLYARGHALLADDLVMIIQDESGQLWVLPGFPQFKLWPEAASSVLGDDSEQLQRLAPGFEKRARGAIDQFSRRRRPVGGLYVLAEGPAMEIKPLNPQEAFKILTYHSIAARFDNRILQGENAIRQLRQLSALIRHSRVCLLERSRSLDKISEVAVAVEKDLAPDPLFAGASGAGHVSG